MKEIRNIIFDFGGVLFDIDYQRPVDAFRQLGITDFEVQFSKLQQSNLLDDYETGRISDDRFRERIRAMADRPLSDEQIDAAWNSILIGLPQAMVDFLGKVSVKYRVFLLSNTNSIHEKAFREMLDQAFGPGFPEVLFEKTYLSHRIGKRKPDQEVFDFVLKDAGISKEDTLFIDDSPQHVDAARRAGIKALWLERQGTTEKLFILNGLVD
jgi:FMN phosphatase YigB (HAD superfamily)